MTVAVALCITGAVLSCVAISGTWLVVAASILVALLLRSPFPGVGTIVVFILLSIGVEVVEALAGAWGVTNRGGSRTAGAAAVVGGFAGLSVGAAIPPPFIGSLVGMVAGSFGLVFAVEHRRLKKAGRAANIAWGTVTARVLVILLKVCVTLGMSGYLLLGLLL